MPQPRRMSVPVKEPRKKRSGYGTNLASEFYVMSMLHRLGLNANLTLGNQKAVDIVVVRAPGDVITIDVKAVAGSVDWLVGSPEPQARAGHYVVLLTYDGKLADWQYRPRAWVLPHNDFLPLVKSAKAPSTMRFVSRSIVTKLTRYAENWELLRGAVAAG
jgi:hypothetical protein